jgi:Ca-activated chloride channel family protein
MAPARAGLEDAAAPTSARGRMPMTFSAVPAALRAGKAVTPAGAALSLEDVRTIAATEARRLREGASLPAHERRDQLDDLLSRLSVLVTGLTADEYSSLRELVTLLGGDGSVDEKWAAALRVLTEFGGAGGETASAPPEQPSRKAFWKR